MTQFDSNMHYRAWGTLKSETFGNGFTQSATYNSRLQMTAFEVRKPSSELQMSTATQFYADGQVQFSDNSLDERFDRAFAYDHAARTSEAYSGSEARDFVNGTSSGTPSGPYRQSYQLSQFNQITQQTNRLWSDTQTTNSTFTNNRRQGWSYDAAGFVTVAEDTTYTRDAAGRNIDVDNGASHGVYSFDGDGRVLKTVLTRPASVPQGSITLTSYYANSTVLDGLAVAELAMNGQRIKSHVYAGRRKLATVLIDNTVNWSHEEPVTGSRGDSTAAGAYLARSEFNADGIDVGLAEPEQTGFESAEPLTPWGALGLGTSCSSANPNCITCYVNGFEWDCSRVNWDLVKHCKNNDCGPEPKNSEPSRPSTPPQLVPPNPDRPFDPNIEQLIRSQDGTDILGLLLSSLTAGSFTPQKPGPGSFWDCFGKAGLKGTNFNPDAADLVRRISQAEGTAEELLALTWMKESIPVFNQRPAPNTDTDPNNPLHWDYGPFQLNAYWTNKMIEKGEIKSDGIAVGSALGGHGAKAGQPFEGDPFENGRLAARILNFHGTGETAAGAFTGGSRVANRAKAYREWAPRFKNFFDCWKG